ncbi:MAG: 2-dehydropantoate 2-reductase, partial [Chloroflexi bacterium]|nr:2-dehydropantoate 2-reductase [Chloroflexota bacterium]
MSTLQSVAVIGSGAVGSYYGGRIAESGHDVRFLVRRDYHAVNASGLNVTSPDGDFTLTHPQIFKNSEDIGPVDWVICALKATSIDDARKLVQPCITSHTRILVLMNGLGLEDSFARWFGGERIFGGMAFTCINRGKPGHVHHLAYGQVTVGHFQDNPSELTAAMSLWSQSKVQVIEAPSLLRARWEKLCWNIPFAGLCVAAGGITTDRILADPGLHSAAVRLMKEVIAAGNADLKHHSEHTQINRDAVIDSMFKRTATMGAYRPSTMIDFVEGRTMEIEAIFGEPLNRALALKVPVPYLTLLTALLRSLNSGRE